MNKSPFAYIQIDSLDANSLTPLIMTTLFSGSATSHVLAVACIL